MLLNYVPQPTVVDSRGQNFDWIVAQVVAENVNVVFVGSTVGLKSQFHFSGP